MVRISIPLDMFNMSDRRPIGYFATGQVYVLKPWQLFQAFDIWDPVIEQTGAALHLVMSVIA